MKSSSPSLPPGETGTFRILLVEDQVRHQQIYAQAITDSLSATVDFAVDGITALAKMRADEPPDMVILDLEIPELSGEEVLAGIRADHRLRYTPVIILTGLSSEDMQMKLLELGADDFIEKGAAPEILIARLKAQMRHKLAVDRLERLALDRDLFAAGVLQDIGTIKWTIVNHCRQAKEILARDPIGEKDELLAHLDKLTAHGTRLGAYASDVIQSVRETHRSPQIQTQNLRALCEWTAEVSSTTEDGAAAGFKLVFEGDIKPVLADKSFLRLALLNIVQNAVKFANPDVPLVITVSQELLPKAVDPLARQYVTTHIRDNGLGITDRQLQQIFRQAARTGDADGDLSIGLALVAKVMAKMNGHVTAGRVAGGTGSVMSFSLPVAE